MQIGVPREITPGEARVALVPETVGKLSRSGIGIIVERGAGDSAFFADTAYEAAGATIAPSAGDLYERADLIAKIHRPRERTDGGRHEVDLLRSGTVLIALLQPLSDPGLMQRIAARGVTALSMDAIPRIARAQALDALSSMSTVAGYRAVLLAAQALPRFFPLLMTAAGTIPPARVLVIGAGVAGLQAIATARRLGAVVEAFDTRPAVKDQVQSLGATFLDLPQPAGGEDARGYATALSEDAQQRVVELIASRVPEVDVVITTALVPGRRAPLLITRAMIASMKPGSVIVDLAAELGGNCEASQPGATAVERQVTIIAPLNIPASMPVHASQMYSRNVASLLQLMVKDGALRLDFEDQIIRDACITRDGRVVHEATATRVAAAGAA